MPRVKTSAVEIQLDDPKYYFNRELSWLEFNRRVLSEALDPRTPLLERLKFMAIFSANLDEYFMVRVAGLKQQVEADVRKLTPDGRTPQDQLDQISERLHPMVAQQHLHFDQTLRPQLAAEGIHILDYTDLKQKQRVYLQQYFDKQIFPVLTPLAVGPSHPFPYISNLSLNLAVVIKDAETNIEHFARVKVPKVLPRFVPLPQTLTSPPKEPAIPWMGVPLEQVIAHNLESLFPGMNIQACYPFRITRNADLEVEEDEADDLMLAIEKELRKRRLGGSVVRMEIQSSMPEPVRTTLMEAMGLAEPDVYSVEGLLCLGDLMAFMALPLPELKGVWPELKDPVWTPVVPPQLQGIKQLDADSPASKLKDPDSLFSIIGKQDLMLHHPYQSFAATVQQFITEAAYDPHVLAIKMTLYRTSGDSPIINALIAAAENGKQVAVLVELKARFDEENNIQWARKLEKSGVHVVYGVMGLKTHTKTTLVVRREEDRIRRYVHIGTGNYNPKTARIYTDIGILSCHDDLGADLSDLFNYLTGYSRQQSYRKLLVAPVNLRSHMLALIRREIEHAQQDMPGRIVAKMNALVDPTIINNLYQASQAGVKVDLIVRGICCLRPGLKDVSENIHVMSIVGRYLEHSRIFSFHNNGDEEIFIGSADWMPRNLDRRVEAVIPIEDAHIAAELKQVLEMMLADNRQAWELQSDGQYVQRCPPEGEVEHSAQTMLMQRALAAVGGN
ncbi:MAG: polyphosphate kinase 1 [Cyanothece sp. SIO1E1]|nr:polyphosphate kinase 1 [Cyanothece sp. SIO1E1]